MINGIQEYAWGSRDEIPRLTGIPNPGKKPMAELWMGDHPGMPSRIVSEEGEMELGEFIAKHPNDTLGPRVRERFGTRLPFLFKLLSAEKGLSIQVHPSRAQAEEGFRREDENGIPRGAPHRNYKDQNHKPEVLHAITPFWALSGFRNAEDIADDFRRLQGAQPLVGHLDNGDLEGFYRTLMDSRGSGILNSALALAREKAGDSPGIGTFEAPRDRFTWVLELDRQFPDDLGALAPLYLNCLHLDAGEALFLESGLLHAYLHGTGIELMASSDNVLRGGCTLKHVDVPELLRIVRFEPTEDPLLSGIRQEYPGGEVAVFDPPVEEFRLLRLELTGEFTFEKGSSPAILFVADGTVSCRETLSDVGESGVEVTSGGSLFVPAAVERLVMTGPGQAFLATT